MPVVGMFALRFEPMLPRRVLIIPRRVQQEGNFFESVYVATSRFERDGLLNYRSRQLSSYLSLALFRGVISNA
jgi:hypothetical protein